MRNKGRKNNSRSNGPSSGKLMKAAKSNNHLMSKGVQTQRSSAQCALAHLDVISVKSSSSSSPLGVTPSNFNKGPDLVEDVIMEVHKCPSNVFVAQSEFPQHGIKTEIQNVIQEMTDIFHQVNVVPAETFVVRSAGSTEFLI